MIRKFQSHFSKGRSALRNNIQIVDVWSGFYLMGALFRLSARTRFEELKP